MSELVIDIRDVYKVYKLYAQQSYRFLDMLGLLRKKKNAYTLHPALDGVSIQINKGEKVAFIGRNGAGKSTLLKLISNVTCPTSGSITVNAKVCALLQIGAGFHPDFTGRENVKAYLTMSGAANADIDRMIDEIVEFSELEEYIDQPLKTYSSGMGARLMFSASTVLEPDILVLDEVLSVGDAYFARKSSERINELCSGKGTTLLLVTHDIYSASKLCDRMVWIDKGRILADGPSAMVTKCYEESIRAQEEVRLRLKKQNQLKRNAENNHSDTSEVDHLILELHAKGNEPQASPVYFSKIALAVDGQETVVPLGSDAFSDSLPNHLQKEATCWGDEVEWEGRLSRPMLNYGSSFHKIACVFTVDKDSLEGSNGEVAFVLDYWSEAEVELTARCFRDDDNAMNLGSLRTEASRWCSCVLEHDRVDAGEKGNGDVELNADGKQGSGVITIKDVTAVDSKGEEKYVFDHGERVTFRIHYRINDPGFAGVAQVLVAFHRNGVEDVCRIINRGQWLDYNESREGVISLLLKSFPLAEGEYTVTVLITKENYYDVEQSVFFSINPDVYCCVSKIITIKVENGGLVGNGTAVVYEGIWNSEDDEDTSSSGVNEERLYLNYEKFLGDNYQEEYPLAAEAVEEVLEATEGADFSPLEKHSPGLLDYDWANYLRCSLIRMVKVLRQLNRVRPDGAILDIGSYFGNFSVMCAKAGYRVHALDSYREYGESFTGLKGLFEKYEIEVLDFSEIASEDQWRIDKESYQVVICMGVIEHIPHTPRLLLENIDRVLVPGGVLIMDTPNLGYLYKRQQLMRGESVFPPIQNQYYTAVPFEGHHREYTIGEIKWLIAEIGHQLEELETFNYSQYGLEYLQGIDLENYNKMQEDPELREVILSVSKKKNS